LIIKIKNFVNQMMPWICWISTSTKFNHSKKRRKKTIKKPYDMSLWVC